MVKNLPANGGDTGLILGREDPSGKKMETHSSILAWEISWTERPGGLWSMGLQRVRHDLAIKSEREMAAHSSILAWKIPWTVEPGRLPSMGSQLIF